MYERDEPRAALPKEMAALLAQFPIPGLGLETNPTHKFLTADSAKMISLSRDFVAVTDKQYRRWEQFLEEVSRAVEALEQVYHPSFYSRIGLRYRDVIDKSDLGLADEKWDSLVNQSLIGVLGAKEVSDLVKEIRTEALITIDEVPGGTVALRHGLQEVSQNGKPKQTYVIDADFFTTEKEAMGDVFGALDWFNKIAGRLFRWAITDKLHSALIPTEVK